MAALREGRRHADGDPTVEGLLGWTLAVTGNRDEARTIAEQLEARRREGYSPAGPVAWDQVGLGDHYVPIDRPDLHCTASAVLDTLEGVAALNELRAHLEALPAELACGQPCPACDSVSLEWYLHQARFTRSLTSDTAPVWR